MIVSEESRAKLREVRWILIDGGGESTASASIRFIWSMIRIGRYTCLCSVGYPWTSEDPILEENKGEKQLIITR